MIDDRLGEGAMADVYRAHDPDIGRTVAIKVLKPDFARDPDIGARFLREARAAGALSHANIATIYDVGEAQGAAYIAMELIDGQPLDVVLQSQGRMPYERVLAIGQQLAARARLCAPRRRRAPRHQAVEHPAVGRRADRQAARFRRRADRRDGRRRPPTASSPRRRSAS